MKTRTRGRFHCPRCEASRAYAYRRIRRFFVVLSVPVVPLAGEEEFVQCGFCRRTFKPSILDEGRSVDPSTRDPVPPATRRPDTELAGAAASTLLVWRRDEESEVA